MSRLTLSLLIGAVLCASGCKVSPAGKLETGVMISAKHSIFIRNKGEKNPFPVTPENIAAGKEAFSHYCVVCHGIDGRILERRLLTVCRQPSHHSHHRVCSPTAMVN